MAGSDRTEAPTPKRREEARKRGQVARSVEVSSVVALVVAFALIQATGQGAIDGLRLLMVKLFQPATLAHITDSSMVGYTSIARNAFLSIITPVCLGLMVTGLVVNGAQTKMLFSVQAMKPSLGRLNPLSGIKRMFSARALVELGKAIVKISVCGFVVYQLVIEKYPRFLELENAPLIASAGFITSTALEMGFKVSGVLLAMAALDYLYQRQQFEKSLKMSRDDVREEFKNSEGDPQIKGRIRQQQKAFARRRMMQSVPTADVVVTNPTHFAVALKYDAAKMAAPTVVAKGADLIAEQIKKVARENNVPVLENKPLAQALFKMTDIGDEIPGSLYQAVAEVLAFIYQLKQTGQRVTS